MKKLANKYAAIFWTVSLVAVACFVFFAFALDASFIKVTSLVIIGVMAVFFAGMGLIAKRASSKR